MGPDAIQLHAPASAKARLRVLHQPHWSATWIWFGFLGAFAGVQGSLVTALVEMPAGSAQVAVSTVLVLLTAHLMHAHLIAVHAAAHGLLCPARWRNAAPGS